MSVLQLDLSRQKLYMSPDDPLPDFYPAPRALRVTPIYDNPSSENDPSSLSKNQFSPSRSRNDSPSQWLVNGSSGPRIRDYSLPRNQRHDPNSHYPDRHSRSYSRNRSRRRRSSDYYDSDHDYPSYDDHSTGDDRYDYPSEYDRSDQDRYSSDYDDYSPQKHNPRSRPHRSRYDRPDDDRSLSRKYRPSSSQPHHSTHHEPDYDHSPQKNNPTSQSYPPTKGYDKPDDDRSPPTKHYPSSSQPHHEPDEDHTPQKNNPTSQSHLLTKPQPEQPTHTAKQLARIKACLECNQRAAKLDPFRHLKSASKDVQKVIKALPPSPHFCWSQCTGRRKAVCVGINYVGQKNPLKGCGNDARHMRSFLMKYHQFQSQDILLLTDDGQPASMSPTRKNMLDAMNWLIKDAKIHDSLFFHYSGHGGQVKDETGTEADGMDEVIFPVDFKSTSHIIDNDLFKVLVAPLPTGCRLTTVFDSCHSGTILDLPYLHSAHGRLRSLAHITQRARQRGVAPSADVICFAGCKDDETSADTFAGGVAVGAMSYALLKILKGMAENNLNQTYSEILKQLRAVLVPQYSQKPQISGTHPVDMDREFTL